MNMYIVCKVKEGVVLIYICMALAGDMLLLPDATSILIGSCNCTTFVGVHVCVYVFTQCSTCTNIRPPQSSDYGTLV